ncbi:MAG: hypothetical protein QNJ57_13420 [Flavobacteriaceae bacterium]|nr:hypothetical protein [Flavobacteriaceae bacterium]
MKHLKLICLLFFTGMLSTAAQGISKEDLVKSWDIMSKMVVESAKAMKSEDYKYSPGEPVRNFANQINHTTMSNIGLGSMVFGKKPKFKMPSKKNPPKEKTAVIDILKKSCDYFKSNLAGLTEAQLSEKIKWGRPGSGIEITRLKGILIMFSHMQREHGKTMMYLRAKGIKPPPSGSWSFD